MADDNNFSLGDILWEYADYTPEEEGRDELLSSPAPVQPLLSSPAPVSPPADEAPPAPSARLPARPGLPDP